MNIIAGKAQHSVARPGFRSPARWAALNSKEPQGGVATIEFAVVVALFLSLVLLIIQAGILFKDKHMLSMAAIHGARMFASMRGYSAPATNVRGNVRSRLTDTLASTANLNSKLSMQMDLCTLGSPCTTCYKELPGGSITGSDATCIDIFNQLTNNRPDDIKKTTARLTLSYDYTGKFPRLPLVGMSDFRTITSIVETSSEPVQ